ncbi:ferredoxin reductase [Conexibacter stalactiti]|uniref:Ferredoxin reductase n=1 Tax=Conexibacter stalactiti TaxID=1940611 RepID=A0ABU4HX84_9ACTN|nr:ferredoxin reductase [Conexibacter stalactiti]MDW5596674.1 ferredoxin reductase [Conexibacter stalactiti]MEC5037316.1 ferredoxin reductase [Conexibacter stalactiti]
MHVFAEHRRRARGRLWDAANLLTTPLLPDDFLGLVNPLWSSRQPAGRVVAVRRETADSATIAIRPGAGWQEHRAGQHVTVGVEVDGVRHQRSYSLTSPPRSADGCIAITVKAVRDGVVSSHLVHRTRPGALLFLGAASGDFVLPEQRPGRLLFITAGSGVTPVMGILRTLARADALGDVAVVHIDRDPRGVIFAGELRQLAGQRRLTLHEHHTGRLGRPSAAEIVGRVGDWRERETWACGPGELLDGLEAHFSASGERARLRTERFHARTAVATNATGAAASGGSITFTRSGVTVDADGATTLLAAGEAAGALLPSGCRAGVCRTCVGPLRAGVVRDLRSGTISGAPGDVVQTCISVAVGPVEIEL